MSYAFKWWRLARLTKSQDQHGVRSLAGHLFVATYISRYLWMRCDLPKQRVRHLHVMLDDPEAYAATGCERRSGDMQCTKSKLRQEEQAEARRSPLNIKRREDVSSFPRKDEARNACGTLFCCFVACMHYFSNQCIICTPLTTVGLPPSSSSSPAIFE